MSRLLVRENRLVLRPDGKLARDCDPDCCGPTECRYFAHLVPCGPEPVDPACAIPPGKGHLWVCVGPSQNSIGLLCNNSDRGWFNDERQPGAVGIYHNGVCWRWDGVPPVERAQIPEGQEIIEAGTVECIDRNCNDPRCGGFYYAEALPCDGSYTGPRPLYCPAGLPFQCTTLKPSLYFPGQPSVCFQFRRDAPTQEYPPGTPVLQFEPNGPWVEGRTCCQCNCNPSNAPLQHQYCPGSSPGGYCCPDPAEWDGGVLIINAVYRIEQPPEVAGYAGAFSETTITAFTNPANPLVTVNVRNTAIDQFGQVFIQENEFTAEYPRVPCPVFLDWQAFGVVIILEVFDSCIEGRRYNRWIGQWVGRNSAFGDGQPPYTVIRFNWDVRVIAPQPPGCDNDNCINPPPPLPVEGTDNGGVRIRGGGSRNVDPGVAQFMQRHYGGCRGCGDSPNPV